MLEAVLLAPKLRFISIAVAHLISMREMQLQCEKLGGEMTCAAAGSSYFFSNLAQNPLWQF